MPRRAWHVVTGLLFATMVITGSAVPAVFTIDDDSYLVTLAGLRQGRLTVPGTDGLPPSLALAWFDPNVAARVGTPAHVVSTAPPLYAPIALPFSFFGLWGLIALNALAFSLVCLLLFAEVRRRTQSVSHSVLAAVLFGAGGFALEYAQGLWPHMLAAGLVFGSFLLAGRARDGGAWRLALVAGVLAGLAAGVRYQNVVVAVLIGAGLLLAADRRWALVLAFTAGLLVPLGASSAINKQRFDSWNPVSKGGKYLSMGAPQRENPVEDAARSFWARVVDSSSQPAIDGPAHGYQNKDPETGAIVMMGRVVKKAWLQSSPWVALALFALGWGLRRPKSDPVRAELARGALVVFPVLLLFAVAGTRRIDGLCFNQRYFFELGPIAALAVGLALKGQTLPWRPLAVGFLVGLAAELAGALVPGAGPLEVRWVLYVPLVLATGVVMVWSVERVRAKSRYTALTLGCAIGWAFTVHVTADVGASRSMKAWHHSQYEVGRELLPDRAALLVQGGLKDGYGPLVLEKDLVLVDTGIDGGRDVPVLAAALERQGRRVFIDPVSFERDRPTALALAKEWTIKPHLMSGDLAMLELVRSGAQ